MADSAGPAAAAAKQPAGPGGAGGAGALPPEEVGELRKLVADLEEMNSKLQVGVGCASRGRRDAGGGAGGGAACCPASKRAPAFPAGPQPTPPPHSPNPSCPHPPCQARVHKTEKEHVAAESNLSALKTQAKGLENEYDRPVR